MKKILYGYQLFGLIIFLIAFAATFFLADFIQEQSRDVINRSLVKFADQSMKTTEEVLKSPKTNKLLSERQLSAARDEIARYKTNPLKYVSHLTRDSETTENAASPLDVAGVLKKRLIDKTFSWKKEIKEKFNLLIGKIVSDARLFLLSNLLVFAAALFFGLKANAGNKLNYMASAVSSLPVVITVLGFVDRNLLFAFLQNDVGRWSYIASLAGALAWLFYGHYTRKKPA